MPARIIPGVGCGSGRLASCPVPSPRGAEFSDMADHSKDKAQSERFIEAARELGCEEGFGRFDETLRRVAKAPPRPREPATEESRKPRPKRPE